MHGGCRFPAVMSAAPRAGVQRGLQHEAQRAAATRCSEAGAGAGRRQEHTSRECHKLGGVCVGVAPRSSARRWACCPRCTGKSSHQNQSTPGRRCRSGESSEADADALRVSQGTGYVEKDTAGQSNMFPNMVSPVGRMACLTSPRRPNAAGMLCPPAGAATTLLP
jgi:hypothetical protein